MDALVAETLNCKAALQWMKLKNVSKAIFETDSLLLASTINNPGSYFSLLGLINQVCINLLRIVPDRSISFASRSANFGAHFLARGVGSEFGLREWVENPRVSILDVISSKMI